MRRLADCESIFELHKPDPLIRRRTGFREWPGHQFGGSTLETCGCARAAVAPRRKQRNLASMGQAILVAVLRAAGDTTGSAASVTLCMSSAAATRNAPPAMTAVRRLLS